MRATTNEARAITTMIKFHIRVSKDARRSFFSIRLSRSITAFLISESSYWIGSGITLGARGNSSGDENVSSNFVKRLSGSFMKDIIARNIKERTSLVVVEN